MPRSHKRKITEAQSNIDSARLNVGLANDMLLNALSEGLPVLTAEEWDDTMTLLIQAENAIREAKIVMDRIEPRKAAK